jgi:hypothetical protein
MILADGCLSNIAGFGVGDSNAFPVMWNAFATDAGKVITICWSSIQHGISGSVFPALVPDLETNA